MTNNNTKSTLLIKKVRLLFPNLFETIKFQGTCTNKYGSLLMINKEDKTTVSQVTEIIKELKSINRALDLKSDKVCVRDGNDSPYENNHGYFLLSAKSTQKIICVNQYGKRITSDMEGKLYPGCNVNANVSFWFMNNGYGKRILCNLQSIQFHSDNEAFIGSNEDTVNNFTFKEEDNVPPKHLFT